MQNNIDPRELLRRLGVREKRELEGEELDKFLIWLHLANPTPTREYVGTHCWEFHYNFSGREYIVTHCGDYDSDIMTVEELGPFV